MSVSNSLLFVCIIKFFSTQLGSRLILEDSPFTSSFQIYSLRSLCVCTHSYRVVIEMQPGCMQSLLWSTRQAKAPAGGFSSFHVQCIFQKSYSRQVQPHMCVSGHRANGHKYHSRVLLVTLFKFCVKLTMWLKIAVEFPSFFFKLVFLLGPLPFTCLENPLFSDSTCVDPSIAPFLMLSFLLFLFSSLEISSLCFPMF